MNNNRRTRPTQRGVQNNFIQECCQKAKPIYSLRDHTGGFPTAGTQPIMDQGLVINMLMNARGGGSKIYLAIKNHKSMMGGREAAHYAWTNKPSWIVLLCSCLWVQAYWDNRSLTGRHTILRETSQITRYKEIITKQTSDQSSDADAS